MPSAAIVGWDVGGAHLKAALLEQGRVADVVQLPCALWLGLDRLDAAVDQVQARWPAAFGATGAEHVATMTGELADLFESRRHGVASIAARLEARLGAGLRLFDAGAGWRGAGDAPAAWSGIASANWLATARWLSTRLDEALLVDVGSTTTDLVPLAAGSVRAAGGDDAARLASGELVYHGVVRTPLMALGPRIAVRGVERNLMNELFATSADVYRLTGELDPEHDQQPAADNGAKDTAATLRRLVRMVGLDAADAGAPDGIDFAHAWRARQLAELRHNAARVLAAAGLRNPTPLVVGAGCGDFLARAVAQALGCPYRPIDDLLPMGATAGTATRRWARVAAPCVAVALLYAEDGTACGS